MGTKTNFEKVKDFNRKFNLYYQDEPTLPPEENYDDILLGQDLIVEEVDEVYQELDDLLDIMDTEVPTASEQEYLELRKRITKELSDLLYVVYGMGDRLGLPLDEAFEEVHRSNMSKLDKNGKPVYNEGGKLLKGDNYSPADMGKLFDD